MIEKPFHIKMLLTELQSRKDSNPRYSLRAFAKFLGIGPSNLSRILTNTQDLSLTMSMNLIKKLKLTRSDCLLFIASIAEEKKIRAIHILSKALGEAHADEYFKGHEWMQSNSPDLLFILNMEGKCILANDSVSRFFNQSASSVIGKSLQEMGIPSDVAKKIKATSHEIKRKPRMVKIEDCYTAKSELHCFEITSVPIFNTKNEVRAVACHWKDITEKSRVDKLLNMAMRTIDQIQKSKDLNQLLKNFSKAFTSSFTDAVILQLNEAMIKEGDKNLIAEFQELYPGIIHTSDRSVEVRQHLNEAGMIFMNKKNLSIGSYLKVPLELFKKVSGNMIYIRYSHHSSFSEKEVELASTLTRCFTDGFERQILFEKCS